MEEEVRRLRKELDECQSEDPEASLPLSLRQRFSRSEMARVVMERNQYKEKLIDLQDALRRTQQLRCGLCLRSCSVPVPPLSLLSLPPLSPSSLS
nr:PREDICTED: JNK-interacting protein-like [Lepisosteus oculatus]